MCQMRFTPVRMSLKRLFARQWTRDRLATEMGGDWDVNRLALDLFFSVQTQDARMGVMAEQFARAFGTSAELWRNLEMAYLKKWHTEMDAPRPDLTAADWAAMRRLELRDRLAGQALVALGDHKAVTARGIPWLVEHAYMVADAMLAERE